MSEKREQAQQIAAEHRNDAYSVAVALIEEQEKCINLGRRYENLIDNGLICSSCGGSGFLGNPPDDYYDCPECERSLNKIKAEAVREWANSSGYSDGCEAEYRVFEDAIEYANKLENQND